MKIINKSHRFKILSILFIEKEEKVLGVIGSLIGYTMLTNWLNYISKFIETLLHLV